jgi:hypothetical protein
MANNLEGKYFKLICFLKYFKDLITALIEYATGSSIAAYLSDTTLKSLTTLGIKQPRIFLHSVHKFLLHNSKKVYSANILFTELICR